MNLYSSDSPHKRLNKATYLTAQRQSFYEFLRSGLFTASQTVKATGIPHKSITRYKRQLEKAGKLWEVDKLICPITGHLVMRITTNPALVPGLIKQGTLFTE